MSQTYLKTLSNIERAIFAENCPQCKKTIIPSELSLNGMNNSITVIVGYGHWADDMENKEFCSDKCIIQFFQEGSKKYFEYQTELATEEKFPNMQNVHDYYDERDRN